MRLAYALSSGARGVLQMTKLRIEGGWLVLSVPDADPMFKSGSFARRLDRLADHLGLDGRVERV